MLENIQSHTPYKRLYKPYAKPLIYKVYICETFYSKIGLHISTNSWFNNGNESYFEMILITIDL